MRPVDDERLELAALAEEVDAVRLVEPFEVGECVVVKAAAEPSSRSPCVPESVASSAARSSGYTSTRSIPMLSAASAVRSVAGVWYMYESPSAWTVTSRSTGSPRSSAR